MQTTQFLTAALAGLGTGLALIIAIGAQSAFVLRQGLRGDHVGLVVLVCLLSDVVLIAVGVAGVAKCYGLCQQWKPQPGLAGPDTSLSTPPWQEGVVCGPGADCIPAAEPPSPQSRSCSPCWL